MDKILVRPVGLSAEQHTTVAVAKAGITHSVSGNMVGKESRFGASSSVLYNVASTHPTLFGFDRFS